MMSTVTQRGQTAIPAAIRRRYHIESHSRIEWIDDEESIHVIPTPLDPIKALRGKFAGKNLSGALDLHRLEDRNRDK